MGCICFFYVLNNYFIKLNKNSPWSSRLVVQSQQDLVYNHFTHVTHSTNTWVVLQLGSVQQPLFICTAGFAQRIVVVSELHNTFPNIQPSSTSNDLS